MNILVIQERGRHEANREFREGLSMARALKRLGHQAFVWGLGYENFTIPFDTIIDHAETDIILLLENYDTGWVPDMSGCKLLKAMWSIDSHCALQEHLKVADKQKIDILLNSTEGYIPNFQRPGRRCYWFPNCYDDELVYPMPGVEKNVPIGFCGNYVNRKTWIDKLQAGFGLKPDIFVIGKGMVEAINSYKIHFNRNMSDDVNYRTYETLGCRTMLLTNPTPNLDRLFHIWSDLAVYRDEPELIEKVRYYLDHDKDREEMAEKGYQTVKSKHTYNNRAQLLLEICG
jgi:hypothetical protein